MLRLDHLSKTYADGTRALEGIDLEVAAGEIVALIGGSGCGKTTLLRLIAGLDLPSGGRISLDGETIEEPHEAVGIVFQEPRLLPWLRVADNVAFGLSGLSASERKARVGHALEKVGLREHADRWPRDLSGGQQQRVAIARAFVTHPKVLLLDEPFSALDAFTRASLHEHLLGLWEETRPTVILVTHDVQEAVTLADRVVILEPNPGRIFDRFPLNLARPRNRSERSFETAARRVLTALDQSLNTRQELQGEPQPEPPRQAAFLWRQG